MASLPHQPIETDRGGARGADRGSSLVDRLRGSLGGAWRAALLDQLAGLLATGCAPADAIALLAADASGTRRNALDRMARRLAGGSDLASALAAEGFPPFATEALRSGDTAETLTPLAALLRELDGLDHALLRARSTGIAAGFASVIAAPLAIMFADLFGIVDFGEHTLPLAAGAFGVAVAARLAMFMIRARQRPRLSALEIGGSHRAARFFAILGTLAAQRLPAATAASLAGEAFAGQRWRNAANDIADRLRAGDTLSAAIGDRITLPAAAARLVEGPDIAGSARAIAAHLGQSLGLRWSPIAVGVALVMLVALVVATVSLDRGALVAPAPPAASLPAQPPALTSDPIPFELVGIVGRLPDDAVALLRIGSDRTTTLRPGDSIAGWTLAELSPGEAIFTRGAERRSAMLEPAP